jgi:hypothetical protein
MLEGSCHCGAVKWTYAGVPEGATACNCTVCRRYGALWIYGHEGEGVELAGPTQTYARGNALQFHFCATCSCIAAWRGLHEESSGKRRMAVNVRLAEPDQVADIPIDHFDGLHTFDDLPRDGRSVKDYWF